MFADDRPHCLSCDAPLELPRVFTPVLCEQCMIDAAAEARK